VLRSAGCGGENWNWKPRSSSFPAGRRGFIDVVAICLHIRSVLSTSLPGGRSTSDTTPIGVPLCSQTRKLVEHPEIEVSVLFGHCLDRRIGDPKKLVTEIDAWERQRNTAYARVKWMVTTEKARTKLCRASPQPEAISERPIKESQSLCRAISRERWGCQATPWRL